MTNSILDELQIAGAERAAALEECHRQLIAWGLSLPAGEPLALHFGLKEFRRTGEIEFWIVNEETHGYCGKFLFVFDSQTCPYHHHRVKHETFCIVKGRMKMLINGQERVMSEGEVLLVPPGTRHSFTGLGNALLLEVSMLSSLNDNFFEDKRIGSNGVI